MNNNLKFRALAIVAVILVCIYGIIGFPTSKQDLLDNLKKNIRLGLDLKGGSQLILEVQVQDAFKSEADQVIQRMREAMTRAGMAGDLSRNNPESIADANKIQVDVKGVPATQAGNFRQIFQDNFSDAWIMTQVNPTDYRLTMQPTYALKLKQDTLTQSIATIDRKINGLGLSETSVQQRGGANAEDEIMVQLPGIDDPAHVKQILKTQGVLSLQEVKGGPFPSEDDTRASKGGVIPLDSQIVKETHPGQPPEYWLLARTPVITGRDLRDARAQQNGQTGGWETNFVIAQGAATRRFEQFTGAHIGDRLAIVVDGDVLSAPVIHGKISDNGVIEGLSGQDEAKDLALNLRAGSLPAGITIMEERTVGPSLGADSIREGAVAALAGLIAVVAVMLFYYKRSGINATLALLLNAVILIAALSYFDATLTLPGIAGVILTIGMAVDSNVLIFERIREELRAGKAVVAAVDAGFKKAFLTIIDTHVTTVVSCAFLFIFGTGPVQGFAVTLVIGLIANLFTAVFVSRTIFDWELGMQKRAVTLSI
ncbi:MAG TPA: protein translocase subunit SecD [Bryobacteraceae bacterium]|nr:protein translocase subunit SecD [Bryobacteraceae bacterium]